MTTVLLPDGRTGDFGHCRSCRTPVAFVFNPATGKRPPYNLVAETIGTPEVFSDGISHFATCKDASSWKGRARR